VIRWIINANAEIEVNRVGLVTVYFYVLKVF
jgi:hypothetical protein